MTPTPPANPTLSLMVNEVFEMMENQQQTTDNYYTSKGPLRPICRLENVITSPCLNLQSCRRTQHCNSLKFIRVEPLGTAVRLHMQVWRGHFISKWIYSSDYECHSTKTNCCWQSSCLLLTLHLTTKNEVKQENRHRLWTRRHITERQGISNDIFSHIIWSELPNATLQQIKLACFAPYLGKWHPKARATPDTLCRYQVTSKKI